MYPEAEKPVPMVRGRAIILALLGIAPLTLFVQWSDLQVGGTMAAGPFPPLAACLQWGILLALDSLIARCRGGTGLLYRGERLFIVSIWLVANMAAGRGLLHPLLSSLTGPSYYARSGVVKTAVAQYLPDWLAVTDREAVRRFYEGYAAPVPWSHWYAPLLTWTLFLVPFLTANVCLCALFERVWVRQERLAFPLVALPLEQGTQAGNAESALQKRIILIGMLVPFLLHGFGVAHAYLPSIPCIPFFNDVSTLVNDLPWTAARPLYINIYPLLIGLTFLAPADVTFSLWFFLLLNKAELLMTASAGWNEGTGGGVTSAPPYIEEQSAGAFLALAALLVWNARNSLYAMGMAAFAPVFRLFPVGPSKRESGVVHIGTDSISNAEDYASYRPLIFGFLFGIAGVLAWGVWIGMPFWFWLAFIGFYLAVALVLSRLMAEGGVSWILAPILPDKLILSLTGAAALTPVTITRLMLQVQHLRDTRQMLAPAVFETGKLRDVIEFPKNRFYGLLLLSVFLALGIGVYSALTAFYHYGALTMMPNSDGIMMSANVIPNTAVNQTSTRLLGTVKPAPAAGGAMIVGALLTWALYLLRMRFLGWPLHPLGYALTGTLQTGYANKMLFSIIAGWMLKTLTLRFGGRNGFRLLRGAALGLILGDLIMGGLLKLLDALLGPSGYAIF